MNTTILKINQTAESESKEFKKWDIPGVFKEERRKHALTFELKNLDLEEGI